MKNHWKWALNSNNEHSTTKRKQRDIENAELQFFGFKNDSLTYDELKEVSKSRLRSFEERHRGNSSSSKDHGKGHYSMKPPNIVKSLNQVAGVTKKYSSKLWKSYMNSNSRNNSSYKYTSGSTPPTTTVSSMTTIPNDFGAMFPSSCHRPPPLETISQDLIYDDVISDENSSSSSSSNNSCCIFDSHNPRRCDRSSSRSYTGYEGAGLRGIKETTETPTINHNSNMDSTITISDHVEEDRNCILSNSNGESEVVVVLSDTDTDTGHNDQVKRKTTTTRSEIQYFKF